MPLLVCTVSGRLHPERVRRRPRLGRCRQGTPSPGGEPERVARRCRDVSRTRPSKRCTGERPPGCQPARVDRRWLGPRTPCKRRPRVLSPDGAPVRVERPCDSSARLRVERPCDPPSGGRLIQPVRSQQHRSTSPTRSSLWTAGRARTSCTSSRHFHKYGLTDDCEINHRALGASSAGS